jgi:hypothetical protein
MSYVDYFRSRASAYRQLANESEDEKISGDMYEIASMFSRMADDLRDRELVPIRNPARSHLFEELRGWLHSWLKYEAALGTVANFRPKLFKLLARASDGERCANNLAEANQPRRRSRRGAVPNALRRVYEMTAEGTSHLAGLREEADVVPERLARWQ